MMSSIHIQTNEQETDSDEDTNHLSSMDKSIFVKKSTTSLLSPQYTLETMSSWTSSCSPSSLALQSSLSALVQNKIDNSDNHQSSPMDESIFIKKSNSLPSPQYTLETMSSWTSSGSPSSLALQSSLSIWPSSWLGGTVDKGDERDDSEDTIADNKLPTSQENSDINTKTTTAVDELKKWVEDALINNKKPQSYATDAREEMCKDQYNNELTSNRKAWVEETLLSAKPQSYTTDARNEMCKDQNSNEVTTNRKQWIESTLLSSTVNDKSISPVLKEEILNEIQQLPSSVSKRSEWLADVTHIKTSSELEDEVRHEFELAKMKKEEEDEAAAKKKLEEEKMLKEKEEEERVRVAYEKVAEATKVAEEEERIRNLFATAEMRIKKARQMEKENKKRGLALNLHRQKKKTFSMTVNFDSSDSPVVNSNKASLKRSRVDDNETIEEGSSKQVADKKRKTLKVKKLVKRFVPKKTMRK